MQQQVFTKEFIYNRIKDSGFPCWNLSMQNGFRNFANVMTYYGIDWNDEDTDDTKIEKSLSRLEQTLSTFPPETVFVIEIKAGRNATGSAILGPFYFSLDVKQEENTDDKPKDTQPQPSPQLGTIPQGYVPESMLKGLEDSLTKNFEARIDALKAEQAQARKEQEYQMRLEKLEEREKDIKDLEKSYKSDVAKGADVVVEIVKKIGAYFLMPKGAQADTAAMAAMGAQPPQLGAPQQRDEKADAVDDLAAFLYQNFTADQIKQMKSELTNTANGNQMAQQTDDGHGTATAAV